MADGAVLYHEPEITTILIQSSFVLALTLIDYVLDRAIYCGLIGQILVGMAYGTPGGDILGTDFQQAITDLGYIGLILIVFEGGLSTNIKALRSNLVLSLCVALTGITLPIGLSFLLVKMCDATILQAFAAGCALSSTSLGTTFTILKTSNLENSRLGVVLTSAAMLDDVVGLVLVQVIANLGTSSEEGISASTVVRPVFVSLGYALLVPVMLYSLRKIGPSVRGKTERVKTLVNAQQTKFLVCTLLLIGGVASAAYAGTSVLFAAYLVGLLVTSGVDYSKDWQGAARKKPSASKPLENVIAGGAMLAMTGPASMDNNESWEMVSPRPEAPESHDAVSESTAAKITSYEGETAKPTSNPKPSLMVASTQTDLEPHAEQEESIYETYYGIVVNRLLKGFFFASIGLSIPITRLFAGPTLWRGIIYFLLMTLGKLACGCWLIRFSSTARSSPVASEPATVSSSAPAPTNKKNASRVYPTALSQWRPQSLYPASILGNAMVARGEIGFLISAIAQANGIFTPSSSSSIEAGTDKGDIFLIVTWAILLCTIVGPISVGLLTRRVKRLRRKAEAARTSGQVREGRHEDPLGVWADI